MSRYNRLSIYESEAGVEKLLLLYHHLWRNSDKAAKLLAFNSPFPNKTMDQQSFRLQNSLSVLISYRYNKDEAGSILKYTQKFPNIYTKKA